MVDWIELIFFLTVGIFLLQCIAVDVFINWKAFAQVLLFDLYFRHFYRIVKANKHY